MTRPSRRGRDGFDWAGARERLARAIAATERSAGLSPGEAEAVMKVRARALAEPLAPPRPEGERWEALVFSLAGERYAIASRFVREVIRATDLTPIPGPPDHVLGVMNLRGVVVLVADLPRLLDVPERAASAGARIIVLGGDRAKFGVLVDAADEVTELAPGGIEKPLPAGGGWGREYLRGVTPDGVIVIDGTKLLGDGRLVIDERSEP